MVSHSIYIDKAAETGRRLNMGVFLNSSAPYENYKEIASDMYFVDKSPIIGELFPALGKREQSDQTCLITWPLQRIRNINRI